MENNTSLIPLERIGSAIRLVRGQKVLLDNDLARLYGAETRVLNQAVKSQRRAISRRISCFNCCPTRPRRGGVQGHSL